MSKKTLFTLWGVLFAVCAGLGFLGQQEGAVKVGMTVLAAAFFVPGGVLLYRASEEGDTYTIKLIRNLSLLSLLASTALILANFASVQAGETAGLVLHSLLVVVSSPMFCGQSWILGLFGWACLLFAALSELRRK